MPTKDMREILRDENHAHRFVQELVELEAAICRSLVGRAVREQVVQIVVALALLRRRLLLLL